MKYTGSAQGNMNLPDSLKPAGQSPDPDYSLVGQLETEDIVILCLSAILIFATVLLATTVL